MKTALQFAAIVALLCLAVGETVLSYDTHRIARQADTTLRDLDDELKVQGSNLAIDEQHLEQVLSGVDVAVGQFNAAAAEQRAYWQKTSADSDKTVKALRLTIDRFGLFVSHSDASLNSFVLPDLDLQMRLASEQAQLSLASFGHAGDVLAFQLDDPAISDLAKNLDQSAATLTETSAHLEKTTADIEQAVHRLTRPPSLAKRIGMGILDVGAKLGSMAAGFVR